MTEDWVFQQDNTQRREIVLIFAYITIYVVKWVLILLFFFRWRFKFNHTFEKNTKLVYGSNNDKMEGIITETNLFQSLRNDEKGGKSTRKK